MVYNVSDKLHYVCDVKPDIGDEIICRELHRKQINLLHVMSIQYGTSMQAHTAHLNNALK